MQLDAKSVHKPIVAACSVVHKGCGVRLLLQGSCILPANQTKYINTVARLELKRDVFMVRAEVMYGDVCQWWTRKGAMTTGHVRSLRRRKRRSVPSTQVLSRSPSTP